MDNIIKRTSPQGKSAADTHTGPPTGSIGQSIKCSRARPPRRHAAC